MKPVQEKIYTILSGDATLQTLLGGTASDKKIYPSISDKFEAFPCITYSVIAGEFRSVPKYARDITIEFHIYAKSYPNRNSKSTVEDIFARMNTVLNYYSDTTPLIRYLRQSLEMDVPETDRQLFGKVVRYTAWTYDK